MFPIEYVTSRDSDQAVEQVTFDGRTLQEAAAAAQTVLQSVAASIMRRGAPVIGYLIRDVTGVVVRCFYKVLI